MVKLPDFNNLEIAFAAKTEKELKKARRLFSLVKSPFLVKTGKILLHFALIVRFPIRWIVKPTIFSHFCGGETIEECTNTINLLARSGIKTILDYSVEGSTNENDFEKTAQEIHNTIKKAEKNSNISFCVFKPSGVSRFSLLEKSSTGIALSEIEKEEFNKVFSRIDKICSEAAKISVPVFFDAEESWIQNAIDEICEKMSEKYNKEQAVVFNTVQMYRTDRLEYLKMAVMRAKEKKYFSGFKLVRGAYMEKERKRAIEKNYQSPVYHTKYDTDASYNSAIEFCIDNIDAVSVCAATHNEESVLFLIEKAQEKGILNTDHRLSFAQLLGMSDHISFNLAHHGYNVSKYVPYGPVRKVMPYLIRRAEENTSIAGQTSRELLLLCKELKNRRNRTIVK